MQLDDNSKIAKMTKKSMNCSKCKVLERAKSVSTLQLYLAFTVVAKEMTDGSDP